VLAPRGLIVPTNLQSMGFGIGAAIGAAIGDPSRTVVALVGDGGLAMSGLEIATAVREKLRLVVIVFVDGAYGLIRFQQLAGTGRTFATELVPVDVAALADAVGARHVRVEGDADATLRNAIAFDGVTLVEVAVGDSLPMHWMRAKSLARGVAGKRARSWLKRLLGR
jgi:acetolactate synthase-1/2/3 large subunit